MIRVIYERHAAIHSTYIHHSSCTITILRLLCISFGLFFCFLLVVVFSNDIERNSIFIQCKIHPTLHTRMLIWMNFIHAALVIYHLKFKTKLYSAGKIAAQSSICNKLLSVEDLYNTILLRVNWFFIGKVDWYYRVIFVCNDTTIGTSRYIPAIIIVNNTFVALCNLIYPLKMRNYCLQNDKLWWDPSRLRATCRLCTKFVK